MRRTGHQFAIALLAVAAIAAGLRATNIEHNPPELFEDELSGVVSAWSIVTTGHDVERTILPFMVTRLEVKQPIYFLATVPFQAVFGDGPSSVRMPAILFGVLATLLVVWSLLILHAGRRVAIIGGLLFAISPWAIHYGRAGWEPAAFLPFAIGGTGALWLGLRDHRRGVTVGAAVIFALGAYSYHPALLMDIVVPVAILAIRARTIERRDLINLAIGGASALVILVPYALAATDPLFLERTRGLSVFRSGVTLQSLTLAWDDYWAQWSPAFLIGGAAPNPRINPGTLVYIWMIPCLALGLDRLLHRRRMEDWLLLAWLVLAPLPAALADDKTTPHAARGLLAVVPIVMISAIGIGRLPTLLDRHVRARGARLAAAALMAIAAMAGVGVFYQHYYTGPYVARSANWWGYGSGAALRLAGSMVPAGGTLCVATPDISGLTFPHQLRYYLPSPSFRIIQGVRDPACHTAGTYVLALVTRDLGDPVRELGTVADIHGDPFFRLVEVEAAS